MRLNRTRVPVVMTGMVVLALFAAAAFGSPGSAVEATNLVAKADLDKAVRLNSDGIKLKTRGPTDVRVQTLTFAPGAFTGWHHHPGFVLVAVESGQVTVFDSRCHAKAYGPGSPNGSAFVEYGDRPLEVRNTTATPATVYATFVAPNTDAGVFRLEDPVQACP